MTLSLKTQDLSFRYRDTPIFSHQNFEVPLGEFSVLSGPSGSGKSTLLKLLAGLYPRYGGTITSGNVYLEGQVAGICMPFERAQRVSMLFQHPARQFSMRTVAQQIDFACANLQVPKEEVAERRQEVLKRLNLEHLAQHIVTTLSGGEQQCVALACVLAMRSKIILLDEPFANVDVHGRAYILKVLKGLQTQEGTTIFLADHELEGYQGIATKLFSLSGETHELTEKPLDMLPEGESGEEHRVTPHPLRPGLFSWSDLSYGAGERTLVKDSRFTLPKGQVGLLSGDNGVGKSTLFKVLSCQHDYTGTLTFEGQDAQNFKPKEWAMKVGLTFQSSEDQFVTLTMEDELSLSAQHSLQPKYWDKKRIASAVEELGLTGLERHVVYRLSGGQQKKLQLLSMLIMGQPTLLADEPFAGLDAASVRVVLNLLCQTVEALEPAVLVASHQRAQVAEACDYELRLEDQHLNLLGEEQ